MKKVFIIILSFLAFSSINAQVSTTLDGTGSYVTGGDGTGSIVSYSWTIQGTPPAAVILANASQPMSKATFTQKGDYYLLLTVTDNKGAKSSAVDTVTIFAGQVPHAKATNSHIYLSLPGNSTFNYEKYYNRSIIDNRSKLFFIEGAKKNRFNGIVS